MGKEKLFTPEDFDKESRTTEPRSGTGIDNNDLKRKKLLRWLFGFLFLCGIIVLIVCLKGCDAVQSPTEVSSTTTTTDVVDKVVIDTTKSIEVSEIPLEEITLDDIRVTEKGKTVEIDSNAQQSMTSERNVTSDVETEAYRVIRGEYGNNPERKLKLGPKYQPIQNRVNDMKRKGVF